VFRYDTSISAVGQCRRLPVHVFHRVDGKRVQAPSREYRDGASAVRWSRTSESELANVQAQWFVSELPTRLDASEVQSVDACRYRESDDDSTAQNGEQMVEGPLCDRMQIQEQDAFHAHGMLQVGWVKNGVAMIGLAPSDVNCLIRSRDGDHGTGRGGEAEMPISASPKG
jgi:hypothetical protein